MRVEAVEPHPDRQLLPSCPSLLVYPSSLASGGQAVARVHGHRAVCGWCAGLCGSACSRAMAPLTVLTSVRQPHSVYRSASPKFAALLRLTPLLHVTSY